MTVLTWTPATFPSVSPLVFETGPDAVLRLLPVPGSGIDAVPIGPISSKGPGQEGESALDVTVPPRVVIAQAIIQTADLAGLWTQRRAIARAFAASPVRYGGELSLGTLLLERPSVADLEIDALPRSVKTERTKAPGIGLVDAEWLCPYPYWRDTVDSTIANIAQGTGNDEIGVNAGDVDAPIVAQLWGPATAVTLTDLTTGEQFTITPSSALLSTDYLEVDTTPGRKKIERVDDLTDTRVNAMGGLDLTDARLFLLHPGNNAIEYTATGATGATHAVVTWRNRYAGV